MNNYHKDYYKKDIKKNTDEEYIKEFLRVTSKGGKNLTTKGFDEVSLLPSRSIIKGLNKSWKQLLEENYLMDELYEYVVAEYQNHAYKMGKANTTCFVTNHPYINKELFSKLDSQKVRKLAGFINKNYKGLYNDFLLRKHFEEVQYSLAKIPSVSEFLKYGKILPSIYCDYYGIKGQKWDEVLEIMINDKGKLEKYIKERDYNYIETSRNILREYKLKNKIPESVLEEEFKRVFNHFLKTYGTHPTRRLFNEYSNFNDMTYRKRYKMKWSEIIKYYGYQANEKNITEKIFLEKLKKILSCDYERNKTWDWLIGINNKHLNFDGYFKDVNLVVEFDGKHHRTPVANFGGYERFIKDQKNDAVKEKLVQENGYKFLRVSSKENWQEEEYLKEKLRKFCGREI